MTVYYATFTAIPAVVPRTRRRFKVIVSAEGIYDAEKFLKNRYQGLKSMHLYKVEKTASWEVK